MKPTWILLLSLPFLSGLAKAVEPSIKAHLTEEGFQVISDEISMSALPDISSIPIPDQSGSILALHYAVKGIQIDGKFADIKLTPKEGSLELKLKIKDLKIKVSEFSLGEYFPLPWNSKCKNLVLEAGSNDPVTAELAVGAKLTHGGVKFEFQKIKFRNVRQDYRVHGPSYCSLPIPVGQIMQVFIHEFLLHTEPLLEMYLKYKMISAEDKIGTAITHALTVDRDFQLPEINGVPPTSLNITGHPIGLRFNRDGAEFSYYVSVKRRDDFLATSAVSSSKNLLNGGILANLSLNTALVNQIIAESIPNGTTEIEINNDLLPDSEEILTKSVISAFIPDLLKVPTDSEKMRLRLQLRSAPSVVAVSETQSLTTNVNNLVLTFMISQEGKWRDYYAFNFNLSGNFAATITDEHVLKIRVLPGFHYDFTGKWAPDYQPTIPSIDQDALRETIDSVLDYLYEQENIFSHELPILGLGNDAVTVATPKVDGHYLSLDLIRLIGP